MVQKKTTTKTILQVCFLIKISFFYKKAPIYWFLLTRIYSALRAYTKYYTGSFLEKARKNERRLSPLSNGSKPLTRKALKRGFKFHSYYQMLWETPRFSPRNANRFGFISLRVEAKLNLCAFFSSLAFNFLERPPSSPCLDGSGILRRNREENWWREIFPFRHCLSLMQRTTFMNRITVVVTLL